MSRELKSYGLCWNQNRDSGAGQSRTIQCNPPTMTATQSGEKTPETTQWVPRSIASQWNTLSVSVVSTVFGGFSSLRTFWQVSLSLRDLCAGRNNLCVCVCVRARAGRQKEREGWHGRGRERKSYGEERASKGREVVPRYPAVFSLTRGHSISSQCDAFHRTHAHTHTHRLWAVVPWKLQ